LKDAHDVAKSVCELKTPHAEDFAGVRGLLQEIADGGKDT
jgi:hypothetical protein